MAMQRLLSVSCAMLLAACGRIAQGTDTDNLGSNSAPIDCTYGKIASVPGLPLGVASTGKSIFVVSYDVGGDSGDLRAITSDGQVHLLAKDNVAVGMIAAGSKLVFSERNFDATQDLLLGETINVVDDTFAVSQLDTTTDSIAQVDSLIGDGQGNVYWQRWAKGDLSDIPAELGSVSLEKYTGGSTITVAGNSGTNWATDIVTDGTDFYGLIAPQDPSSSGNVVGRVAIGATPALVLATNPNEFNYFQGVVGVDDTNVVYLTYGSGSQDPDAWAVPKNGGAPFELIANETTGNSPVLYDHHLYFVEQNVDGTSTVSRVTTAAGASVEQIATESTTIGAIAVDACGVIYAVTDSSSPGLTGTTIYRSKI